MPSRPVPIFLRASARFFYPLRARPRCVYMPSTPPPAAPLPYSSLPPDPSPPSPQRPPRVRQGTPPRGGRPQPRHVRRRPGHLLGHRRWRPLGATVCGVRGRPGRGVAQGEGRERENTKKNRERACLDGWVFFSLFHSAPSSFQPPRRSSFLPLLRQGWTPLQYAIAKGKYGPTEEAGIYPEDVLRHYGATKAGEGLFGPPSRAAPRSPRASFDPRAPGFVRERGTYQEVMAHP